MRIPWETQYTDPEGRFLEDATTSLLGVQFPTKFPPDSMPQFLCIEQ
jgi:hypothetical protein